MHQASLQASEQQSALENPTILVNSKSHRHLRLDSSTACFLGLSKSPPAIAAYDVFIQNQSRVSSSCKPSMSKSSPQSSASSTISSSYSSASKASCHERIKSPRAETRHSSAASSISGSSSSASASSASSYKQPKSGIQSGFYVASHNQISSAQQHQAAPPTSSCQCHLSPKSSIQRPASVQKLTCSASCCHCSCKKLKNFDCMNQACQVNNYKCRKPLPAVKSGSAENSDNESIKIVFVNNSAVAANGSASEFLSSASSCRTSSSPSCYQKLKKLPSCKCDERKCPHLADLDEPASSSGGSKKALVGSHRTSLIWNGGACCRQLSSALINCKPLEQHESSCRLHSQAKLRRFSCDVDSILSSRSSTSSSGSTSSKCAQHPRVVVEASEHDSEDSEARAPSGGNCCSRALSKQRSRDSKPSCSGKRTNNGRASNNDNDNLNNGGIKGDLHANEKLASVHDVSAIDIKIGNKVATLLESSNSSRLSSLASPSTAASSASPSPVAFINSKKFSSASSRRIINLDNHRQELAEKALARPDACNGELLSEREEIQRKIANFDNLNNNHNNNGDNNKTGYNDNCSPGSHFQAFKGSNRWPDQAAGGDAGLRDEEAQESEINNIYQQVNANSSADEGDKSSGSSKAIGARRSGSPCFSVASSSASSVVSSGSSIASNRNGRNHSSSASSTLSSAACSTYSTSSFALIDNSGNNRKASSRGKLLGGSGEFSTKEESSADLIDENNNRGSFKDAYAAQKLSNHDDESKASASAQPNGPSPQPGQLPATPPPPPPPPPPALAHFNPVSSVSCSKTSSILQAYAQVVNPATRSANSEAPNRQAAAIQSQSKRILAHTNAMPAFIPPQFSAPPKDGNNIKPSEYLKRMSSNSTLATSPTLESRPGGSGSTSASDSSGPNGQSSCASTPIGSLSSSTGASFLSGTSEPNGKFERAYQSRGRLPAGSRFKPHRLKPLGELNRSQSTSALSTIADDLQHGLENLQNTDGDDSSQRESSSNYSSSEALSSDNQKQQNQQSAKGVDLRDKRQGGSILSRDLNNFENTASLMNAIRNFDKTKFLKNKLDDETCTNGGNRQVENLQTGEGKLINKKIGEHNSKFDDLLAATKRDLIAELKESKGLDGIKRMQELSRSELHMNNSKQLMIASKCPELKLEDFIDKVSEMEPEAPLWKKQMLAKKAIERAKKECEDKVRREMEEKRLSEIPQWKRQMLARKAAERSKRDINNNSAPDNKSETPVVANSENNKQMLHELPIWRKKLTRIKLTASTGNVNEA